ncbi:MAG: hypothetical protein ACRENL_11915 [Candidatus Dormibacteria bacterium]
MASQPRRAVLTLATVVFAAAVVAVPIARTHAALSDFAVLHSSASAAVWGPKDNDSQDNDSQDNDAQDNDENSESDHQGIQNQQSTIHSPQAETAAPLVPVGTTAGGPGGSGDCLTVPTGLASSAAAPLQSWPLTLLVMYAGTNPLATSGFTGSNGVKATPPALSVDGTVTPGAHPTSLTSSADPAHSNGLTLSYTVPTALHDGRLHVLTITAFEDDHSTPQACTATFYVSSVGP